MSVDVNKDSVFAEKEFLVNGKALAGVDEVGRGPWAGPVTAGCVVLDGIGYEALEEVNDSKKLKQTQREVLVALIEDLALGCAVADVDPGRIDEVGIAEAVRIAMTQAVERALGVLKERELEIGPLLIDGEKVRELSGYEQIRQNKADGLYRCTGAASILAKEHRDNLMRQYGEQYPEYGFESHVGYGTKQHKEALSKHGPTPIHRYSYKPVKEAADNKG